MTKTLTNTQIVMTDDYAPKAQLTLDEIKLTTFKLGLPDTIEKVIVSMGGRTVEFDVNKFMDVLESFK